MKVKKFIGVLFGACTLAMLTGCYEPLDITESEMDMVAEYAAGVLVKYGTNTTDSLLDREEQEEAFAEMATPTPRPTYSPVKGEQDDPDKEEQKEDEDGQKTSPTAKPTVTPVPDNTEMTMSDFTKLMGKEDFFFRYTGYETTVLYQGEGELFAAAGEGKQLIVLSFEVTNRSDSGATLTLNKGASKEFVYTLRIGGKSIRPCLTLLEEDFYTSYEKSFKAGETKKCVLVFECDEKTVIDTATLSVLKDVKGNEDAVLIKVK